MQSELGSTSALDTRALTLSPHSHKHTISSHTRLWIVIFFDGWLTPQNCPPCILIKQTLRHMLGVLHTSTLVLWLEDETGAGARNSNPIVLTMTVLLACVHKIYFVAPR
jgi:hypothetical protein